MRFVVDTSVLAAILFREAEREQYLELLLRNRPIVSAATMVEAEALMMRRKGPHGVGQLRHLSRDISVEIVAFELRDLEWARSGLDLFGRGRREYPAALNLGDLFAYALARRLDVPLLFKGDDFPQTDIRPALTI